MLNERQWSFLAGNLSMGLIAYIYGPRTATDIVGTTVVAAFLMVFFKGLKRETTGS